MNRCFSFFVALGVLAAGSPLALSAQRASSDVHVRGTVQNFRGQVLTVATPAGSVRVQLAPRSQVSLLMPSDRAHIKDGSFVGITSVRQADGSQRAVEVHLFPESMRGAGEGSRAWDLPGAGDSRMTNGAISTSKMTNGTVSGQEGGSTLTLQYKSGAATGSQVITIPPEIPVVTFVPGRLTDLRRGAHVFVIGARRPGGTVSANSVLVGMNGVVPPM